MQKNRIRAGLSALLALLLLCASACIDLRFSLPEPKTTADVWAPDPKTPERSYTYADFDTAKAERFTGISGSYGATAVQIALLEGEQIKTFCLGKANRATGREITNDTKYRVASLSKLAVAMTFMAAQERGLVDENADISDYFGEPCRSPYYPDTVITPSMLLTHTAGLDDAEYYTYRSGLLSREGVFLYVQPGTTYYYSNVGYGVLSCLLERAADRSFPLLAKDYLFAPLGIDAAFVYDGLADTSDIGNIYGEDGGLQEYELAAMRGNGFQKDLTLACGNLIISAKDYVKLLGVMMHGGLNVNGARILSEESVDTMLQLRFTEEHFGVAYGSQIQSNVIEDKTLYVHTGSAYGLYAAFAFDPVAKKAAVVLTTGIPRYMDPESEVYYLCQDLLREMWLA